MMQFKKSAAMVWAAAVLMTVLSGCQKEEGPVERAGKAVDNAVQKAGESIEKAGEKIQDAVRDPK